MILLKTSTDQKLILSSIKEKENAQISIISILHYHYAADYSNFQNEWKRKLWMRNLKTFFSSTSDMKLYTRTFSL